MKKILSRFVIALVVLTASRSQSVAQTDTTDKTVFKIWDDFLARLQKEKKTGSATTIEQLTKEDAVIKKTREQWIARVTASLSEKGDQSWKEYTSTYQHKPGDMNLLPLLEEVPAPVYILPLAGQTDVDGRFDPYIQKTGSQAKQIAELAMKDNKMQEVYQSEGEEGLKKRAVAESDKSIMIQQMGGTENLLKMSEAERKAAAMKMANDVKNNPGLLSGNNNPGMNAMMQKMMSDKEYMSRYNKMNTAEKEMELKKFMGQNPQDINPDFDLDKNNRQHDKLMAERNQAKYSQDITLLNMRVQKRVGAATDLYGKNLKAIENWTTDVREKIGKWYRARYAAIPVVELGEYGHDKDPAQQQALDMTVAYLKYYLLETPEMQVRSESWKQYKSNCKYALAELNDFIGSYKWGKNKSENIFSPDADQQVGSGISGAYGLMAQLANDAKGLTTIAKGYQEQFETVINKK